MELLSKRKPLIGICPNGIEKIEITPLWKGSYVHCKTGVFHTHHNADVAFRRFFCCHILDDNRANGKHKIGLPTAQQINQRMSRASGMRTTDLRNILPEYQFVPVQLKRCDGKVAWVNWNLLREINPSATYDPEKIEKDLERYFYIVDETPKQTPRDQAKTGYADRYIVGKRESGSGRFYFLPDENGAGIKGGGRTPLARPIRERGTHQDGRLSPSEAVIEAVAGEVLHHLGIPTTRILALIAPDSAWKGTDDIKTVPLSCCENWPSTSPSSLAVYD